MPVLFLGWIFTSSIMKNMVKAYSLYHIILTSIIILFKLHTERFMGMLCIHVHVHMVFICIKMLSC